MVVLRTFDGTQFVDVSGITDHGLLDGLDDIADHEYALLKSGDRNLEGDLLVEADKEIRFRDTAQRIKSSSANVFDIDAGLSIRFNIGGNQEVRIQPNRLVFIHAEDPNIESEFDWTVINEIAVIINGISQFIFADALIKPVLDDDVSIGTTSLRLKRLLTKVTNPSHPTNPTGVEADMWYNEAENTHRLKAADALHNIVGAEALTVADDVVVNTVTETLFADTKDLAADSMIVGNCYEFSAWGELSTDATIDYTFRLKLDAVVVVTTGTLSQTSGSGGWFLKGYFTVRSIGVFSGSVQGNAEVGYPRGGSIPVHTTAAAAINTETILTVGVSVEMGTAGASKSATLQQLILKKVS